MHSAVANAVAVVRFGPIRLKTHPAASRMGDTGGSGPESARLAERISDAFGLVLLLLVAASE